MAEPQQQLDRRLSSRRRSRALSLGRWGALAPGNGGGGDAGTAAANGDDGDAYNNAAAEPKTALPLLNEYAAAKASVVGSKILELTSFADLSPAIADARFVGPSADKKARAALASTILPRLAMHEGLPASLVKPLLALWHKGRPGGVGGSSSSAVASIDARTSRLALSIAGLLLGPGQAGTPTPLPGAAPPSAAADASASEAVRASLAEVPGLDSNAAAFAAADPSPGLTEGALRLLAAAARGGSSSSSSGAAANNNANSSSPSSSSTKWDADFVSALGVALARGEARAMAFLDANGEAGAAALAALAAAAAEAATEGDGFGAGDGGSTSSKILGALTSSASLLAKRRAAAAAAVADSSDALHGALAAARASLIGRALRDAALRAGAGAGSADPLCARHALALMASVARSDPARAARAYGLISSSSSGRKNSSSVLSSFDLAAAASTALASYETSALVLGVARPSSAGGSSAAGSASASAAAAACSSSLSAPPSPTPGLNLDDPLARVYAARLLGAMLFAGIGGGSAAAAASYASESNGGASLFSLLAALATRDADDMVALEACKALAGWSGVSSNAFTSSLSASSSSSAAPNYSNSTTTAQDESSARDAAARARAFAVLCARAGDPATSAAAGASFVPGLLMPEEASASPLLGALCSRARGALGSRNPPLVCAGARAAAALAEAAVRGYDAAVGGGNSNSSSRRAADSAIAAVASLAAPLAGVTRSSSPAEAELALEALLWMQAMPVSPTGKSIVLDAGKVFALAGCLSESLAAAALAAARRVLAVVAPRVLAASSSSSGGRGGDGGGSSGSASAPLPTALERTLLVSTALVAGSPSRSRGEASLPELWATAAKFGGWRGRAAAARAALAVLEAPCPVLLASSSSSVLSDLAFSVADDVAWTGVQQSAAWWLGEHGNAASGEVVGNGSGAAVDGGGATAATTNASTGSGGAISSAPISAALSLASGRSPLLADIIAALQHACAATLPPHARPTAALSLCKIAARSDEPYCGSAFSFLVALLAGSSSGAAGATLAKRVSSSDPLGLAPFVADAVAALDEVYSSRVALQGLVKGRLAELAAERKEKEMENEKERGKKKKKGGDKKKGGANGINDNTAAAAASDDDDDGASTTALFDEATIAAVREQHNAVCSRLQRLTGLLPDRAYPLGPLSRSLLENGGEDLLQAAVKAAIGERSELAAANDTTTSEERVEAERAKLEALLLGGGRAISEVGSSDEEAEEVEARAADVGGHRRRGSVAPDDDSDANDADDNDVRGEFPQPPPLFSSRSMGFSSNADPLANLTRMLDEQILTGAAAGPTPFAFVKQQQGGGLAAAASTAAASAAEKDDDGDDDDDFSKDPLANYGSNDKLSSRYFGDNDDALAGATATPPPRGGGSEFGVGSQQTLQQPLLLGIVEHAFDAALPEELSVVPGDRVKVRGEADGWLDCVLVVANAATGRDETGSSSGLVPESYVRYVGDVEFAEAGKKQLKEKVLQAQPSLPSSSQLSPQGSLTPRADWLSKPDMLEALVGGGGGSEEEAAGGGRAGGGSVGSRALLERQISANPFGRQGQGQTPSVSSPTITPRALSRRQSDASGAAAAAAAAATTFSPFSYPTSAAFAFAAENDDELSVSEGEKLTVLASLDGWLQVENVAGERGLVPESYVDKV